MIPTTFHPFANHDFDQYLGTPGSISKWHTLKPVDGNPNLFTCPFCHKPGYYLLMKTYRGNQYRCDICKNKYMKVEREYPPMSIEDLDMDPVFVNDLINMVLQDQGYDEATDSIPCEDCTKPIREIFQNPLGKCLCLFCARKAYIKMAKGKRKVERIERAYQKRMRAQHER